jgi:hypothetical protein
VLVGVVVAPQLLAWERKPVVVADRPVVVVPPVVPGATSTTATAADDPLTTMPVPPLDVITSQSLDGPKVTCLPNDVPGTCLVHRGSTGRNLLVIGDSHLQAFQNSFADFGATHDVTVHLWLEFGCPWQRGLFLIGRWSDRCVPRQQQLYDTVLPTLHPDAVVVVNDAYDDPSYPRTMGVGTDLVESAPAPALIGAIPPASAEMMRSTGQFVVIRPWPSLPFSQRDCLSSATFVAECVGTAITPLPSDATLLSTAEGLPGMSIVDLNTTICPRLPTCDAVVDGQIVRMDQDHLTYDFARSIEGELERQLVALGVFG